MQSVNIPTFNINFSYNKFASSKEEFIKTQHLFLSNMGLLDIHENTRQYRLAISSKIFQNIIDNKQYFYLLRKYVEVTKRKLIELIEGEFLTTGNLPWGGAIIYAEKLFPRELKGIKNYEEAYKQNIKIINRRR
jgi:hypothetical protein